jgi:2-dehydro-3-deoxyphosphogluconate aldolase/(4S)-4-hydroxy-2-oxoglutarate aldolase
MDATNILKEAKIVPVIVIENVNDAVPLARALVEGGLPVIEITFRTKAAPEAIAAIRREVPEAIVGAGTLLTPESVKAAKEAGAVFGVAPGFDPLIIAAAKEECLPFCPGVATASELSQAISAGFKLVKFFPAEAAGGVNMIKNLCGPFPQVRFMTTGGISMANIAQYRDCKFVVAVGGSWMAKSDAIDAEKWDEITAKCKEAVAAMKR